MGVFQNAPLREKCPVISTNIGKYRPEKTPHSDTFDAVFLTWKQCIQNISHNLRGADFKKTSAWLSAGFLTRNI